MRVVAWTCLTSSYPPLGMTRSMCSSGRLAAALEDRRVARLERQRPDLRYRVGARLEDDEEDADRARHLLEDEAVVEKRPREDAARGVGKGGDGADAGGHAVHLGLVELEAFEG